MSGSHGVEDSNEVLADLDRTDDALAGSHRIVELAPGVFGQEQAGWLLTIETADGLVQVDTGDDAPGSLAAIRSRTDAPFTDIVFSHGHQRYNLSCRDWVVDAVRTHGRVPRVIAHENVLRRQARYLRSNGLQNRLLERQFRHPVGSLEGRVFPFMTPTHPFRDRITIETAGRTIDVFHAPSETDDAIGLWMREDRVLYGGPGCIPFFPNVGSPQRPVRDALRWAETLDLLAAHPAELLICEFGPPIEGADAVQEYLTSTAAALRWCFDAVVDLMNEGRTIAEIVNMLEPPAELFDRPWLQEGYTSIDHVYRDVYRSQFGWWEDLNPTSLHPAHPDDVAREVRAAIAEPDVVLDRARALRDAGEIRLALHVVDLLAGSSADDEVSIAARELKADLCRRAAAADASYVTQSLYLHAADELERANGRGTA